MSNVTYLFGAGASCNSMPLVRDFKKRLEDWKTYFGRNVVNNSSKTDEFFKRSESTVSSHYEGFLKDIEKLISNLGNHNSIDTYAKKLATLERHDDLHNLKTLITMFFMFEQKVNTPDIRYDSLIASLIDFKTATFPAQVKYMTWNYDLQFDISLARFLELGNYDSAFSKIQIDKLNGTACPINQGSNLNLEWMQTIKTDFSELQDITRHCMYSFISKKLNKAFIQHTAIKYAWESSETELEELAKKYYNTNVLVVIGYSFPFFNRKIDQKVIKSMKLKKVYIQAPQQWINNTIQSFKSIGVKNIVEVIPITETDQFFLPPELTLE